MKHLVFCLLVIANFSNNGKASVDTLGPASANTLFVDNTINTDKSCHRPCKFNVKPRRCYYNFKIKPSIDEAGKASIAINDVIPGPPINVCVNDVIVVEVENRVPGEDLAIHWHGVEQRGTPYMDGVPMVTQCPIPFGSKYKYAFRASAPGTYFYHADAVSHQSDGVFGSLVVSQPRQLEPHGALYDYDREDNVMVASAVFPELMTGNLDTSRITPVALNINGDVDSAKIFVMQNFSYRLRLINAVGVECPVVFSVEGHEVIAIASDSRPVAPETTGEVLLYPGERMDVVVRASRAPGGYWLRARGSGACAGLNAGAMIVYSGFNYTSMLAQEEIKPPVDLTSATKGQDLKSISDAPAPSPAEVKQLYLGLDRGALTREPDNDYRYLSDALPKKPFFPASLSLTDKGVVQINGKNFLYPATPLLLSPRGPGTCPVGQEPEHAEPQCVQTLQAEPGQLLELVLVNEGFRNNDSLTFHMHGYGMQVVATWQSPAGAPVSKEMFLQWDKEGKVKRNLVNGPIKDTITVPNKGYTIVRMTLDNVGSWLLECRSCSSSLPAAVIISVPVSLPKSVLDSLPKCGNYRPPDVLLN